MPPLHLGLVAETCSRALSSHAAPPPSMLRADPFYALPVRTCFLKLNGDGARAKSSKLPVSHSTLSEQQPPLLPPSSPLPLAPVAASSDGGVAVDLSPCTDAVQAGSSGGSNETADKFAAGVPLGLQLANMTALR
eukprot:CAMPEP_0119341932 /NCGR_PEP_ID=MMETSP1333-20130426/103664_1 /TAXON_ID=418940 /ORGANISM="Scyphosphaera apsteinii, Strain RCC1455" /LENGTH=134 /DNA_ID=CAMNT_0007354035 /DNA_START=662 /DNA_END=1067 /DNA_ORIENTATION=-